MVGIKTEREHHFLSRQERNYFYVVEFADCVIDIKEQFPLLPREETLSIADDLGIRHPIDIKSKVPIVMTTDFLITLSDGSVVARTIKRRDDLYDKRVNEKFEIERIYWKKKDIDWGVVSDVDMYKDLAGNIEFIYPFFNLHDYLGMKTNKEKRQLDRYLSVFKDELIGTVTIREIADRFDDRMALEPGTSLSYFKHLLITKQIMIDLISTKINLDSPILIKDNTSNQQREVEAV